MPNLVGTSLNQVPTNSMLGGLAYQDPEHASIKDLDLKNLSQINSEIADTAVDVFVYDTRKDSDGGAWRKRTQNTSWYNETLGTATRGTRKEFPAVAVIVSASGPNRITIYDGDDPDLPMWMEFTSAGGQYGYLFDGRSAESVVALNGQMVIADSLDSSGICNFISDRIHSVAVTGGYDSTRNVADRNPSDGVNKWYVNNSSIGLVGNPNDVAITVLPDAPIDDATGLPVPTIAVATQAGTSIIRDDGTVVDLSGFSPVTTVHIDGSNVIATSNSGTPSHDFIYKTHIPSGDEVYNAGITAGSKNYYMNSNTGTIPLLRDINMSDSTYNSKDNVVYRGGTGGFDIIMPGVNYSSTHSNPAIAYIKSEYNTGYMPGNIEGAFLSDTDTTDLDGTNLITNGTFDSNTTGWAAANGATLTQQSNGNPGGNLNVASGSSSNGYASQTNTVVVGKTYILTFDHYHVDGSQGYVNIGTTVGGSQYVYFQLGTSSSWTSHSFTIKATDTDLFTGFYSRPNGNVRYDNIILTEADPDRSINNNGLRVYGTITKTAVATGAELVGYSGFSATNNLVQPYNSGLNFGTGNFCFVAWIKKATLSTNHYVLDRNDGSTENDRFSFMINSSGKITVYSGASNSSAESAAIFTGSSEWRMVLVKRDSGVITFGLDGKEYTSTTTQGNWATTNLTGSGNENLFIGQYGGGGTPGNVAYNVDYGIGEIANVRISASAPSAEQFEKMYQDEKFIYQENAKATLYGSSDTVTSLAYDDTTNLLHVGTSAGRSEFQGLRRINNTTTAVTTAISASNGLVTEQ